MVKLPALSIESLLAGYAPALRSANGNGASGRDLIVKAYTVADQAHAGQKRASGEPYVQHCLAVASTLTELNLDADTVAAGLLHDVLEDTDVTHAQLEGEFGKEIASLVEGVTKLGRFDQLDARGQRSHDERELESLRKMFLAMVDDPRVVLIKLADRLHNMRTLGVLPEERRKRIAQETLELFAPLANRLGIWQIKWELEDLGFRYLYPDKYKEIARLVDERRPDREHYINQVIQKLQDRLKAEDIDAEITGRPKHIYSIWKKMQRKSAEFGEIYDVHSIRLLVDDVRDRYAALGIVHALWHPIPGQFDDYIAVPKNNLYQSLHTAVIALDGKPLEIQIRTHQMHQVSEVGIAAHWRYKEGSKSDRDYDAKLAWLRQLMDWQRDVSDATEFVEGIKLDIFQDQVFGFTPRGDIKDLPAGATQLDFAYRIHTDVGHRTIGAKGNNRLITID